MTRHEYSQLIISARGNTCEMCGADCDPSVYAMRPEVHHVKPKSKYPELQYDLNNGVVLCHKCHSIITIHERKGRVWPPWADRARELGLVLSV